MTNQKLLKSLYIGRTVFTSSKDGVFQLEIERLSYSDESGFLIRFQGDSYNCGLQDVTVFKRENQYNRQEFLSLNEKAARKHHAQIKIKLLKSQIESKQKEILSDWDEIRDLNKHL